jgi:N-acyl-D-amino-acid deacylase
MNFANFERIVLLNARDPEVKRFEGRAVADIARELGKNDVDTFLDLTLQDDLETEFTITSFNTRVDRMKELLNHPQLIIGLGDGGAHVDILCDASYPTYLLGKWVRERQIMSVERAVQRMTSEPADLFGIAGRGRLKAGNAADIVIFDPETVGSPELCERRYDLPGNTKRMVRPSYGMTHTIVNGTVVCADGTLTGDNSGSVLRA